SACSGWTWLQIQFSVPGFAFSAISHGAVGTITPLGSLASTTAGGGASTWRVARAGTRCLGVRFPRRTAPANPAAPRADSGNNWRGFIGRWDGRDAGSEPLEGGRGCEI